MSAERILQWAAILMFIVGLVLAFLRFRAWREKLPWDKAMSPDEAP